MKIKLMNEAPIILREFCAHLETILGKSPKSVEEYYIDLRTFFRYIKQDRNFVSPALPFEEIDIQDVTIDLIKSITLTDVYEYMNYVATDRANKASTRSRKVSSLRTFFHFLTSEKHYLKENPIVDLGTPKQKRALPRHLTLEDSLDLLTQIEGKYKERDYCMITFFLNCGIRLSELVGLNMNNIRSDGTMRVVGKGNKERVVYLNDACKNALDQYLAVRPVDGVKDKTALFLSGRKQRISPKTVQQIVYKNLESSGLGGQGYSVHKLRHTAATLMYQHGNVDIRALQVILGHENLNTTQIYTHVGSEQVKQAIQSNPLANVNIKQKK